MTSGGKGRGTSAAAHDTPPSRWDQMEKERQMRASVGGTGTAFAGGLALISLGIAGAPVACAEEPPGRDTNAILVELEALQSEQNRLAEKIEDLEKHISQFR